MDLEQFREQLAMMSLKELRAAEAEVAVAIVQKLKSHYQKFKSLSADNLVAIRREWSENNHQV